MTSVKTTEERLSEVMSLYAKLEEIGIPKSFLTAFREDANQYVRDGKERIRTTYVAGLGRDMTYKLTTDPAVPCDLTILKMNDS
jgi:hypothetical protein